ncbi:TIR domain-containing protein [Haloferax sp. Atlit-47N]|uniref:TIR domain-containing protein n=1 Tax=Haloferax sp. Atlit-47N TaxID=2077199 RepID=UPI0018F7754C|nr:TIR domain-containing protein [Haloferax sp. Atlit-47N]
MDLPDRPGRTWQEIRHSVQWNNSIEFVQQDEVPPIPYDFDGHTDVLPGVRVHHRSFANPDDIAIWEPGNTNVYFVTKYRAVQQLLNSKDEIPDGVLAVLMLAGGAFVVKVLWDLLKTILDSDASSSTGSAGGTTQQRPRPENRQYNVFISHAWDYNDDYERVVDFLDDFDELEWQDHSVPLTDPLDTVNDVHLRARLRDQIRTTSVVLVLAGMYSAHREWIQNEIELANEFEKPIIGIRPHGAKQTPNVVEEAATEMVGWRQNSIIRAIVDHSL